jgi:hypothetical protein
MAMRMCVRALTVWLTVGALLSASPVWADQQILDRSAMQRAIAEKDAADALNRQVVSRVLARSEVEAVALRLGLDVKQARAAVAHLDSEALAAVAQPARAVDADLAGGQTIVISVTTLLLIIIIVLLIAD